jgi:excisionase family DNA binding protein
MTTHRAIYTVEEISTLLNLSRGKTYTSIQTGEIPAKKIGGRWVIPKTTFHTWLETPDQPKSFEEIRFAANSEIGE